MADPKQHAAAIAVSLALLTTGEHAVAQSASELETRLEAGASVMRGNNSALPTSALALTPALRYASRRVSFSARGAAWLTDRWNFGDANAALAANVPLMHGFSAELLANADRAFHNSAVGNEQVDAGGRLHWLSSRGGVWLGSGVARPLRVTAVSNVNVSSGGAWGKIGPATLRGSVTSFFFTKVSIDSGGAPEATQTAPCASTRLAAPEVPASGVRIAMAEASATDCRYQSRLTDVESSVKFDYRFVEMTVRGGRRFGDGYDVTPESRQWASAQAAVWISNQIAAVAGGGREPAQPTRGLPARTFATLGVMLAYWPIPRGVVAVETPASLVQAFELRPAGPTLQRITARIGGVETVEVMGDFSDWTPLPLMRRGRDHWELLVPMKIGVHQINMRIDGGQWIAPPGMPTMKDDFNGDVGVVVVKPQN
jgi:hypothetical protein